MEVFNTSKEAGPLWSHTREAWQSHEEADTLSAAGQRAGGAESAGASLCLGHQADAHMYTDIQLHLHTEHTYKCMHSDTNITKVGMASSNYIENTVNHKMAH